MKLASLPKMVQRLPTVLIVAGIMTVASLAHASMTCTRFDEFPVVSDPSIREQLENHVRALPGLKNHKIRSLDGRFFIVTADGGFCKDIPALRTSSLGSAERCGQRRLCFSRNGHNLDIRVSGEFLD